MVSTFHRHIPRVFLFLLIALLQLGCEDDKDNTNSNSVEPLIAKPAATAKGTPDGEATSAVVGAAGGTITTLDGKVALTIPPGALAGDTTIAIQPITNHAHGGSGAAYRLTPEGQTFALPVQLTFTYTDADLAGTAAEAFGIAFQREDGFWEWAGNPIVDTVAKSVTVETTHFSDWSRVKGFHISPQSATVATGNSLDLKVVYCFSPTEDEYGLVPLGYQCEANGDNEFVPLTFLGSVDEWSVNGVPGGSTVTGSVAPKGDEDFAATFTAPALVPAPATVAVSARVRNSMNSGITLVIANITIVELYWSRLLMNGTEYLMTAEDQWTNNMFATIDPCRFSYEFDPYQLDLTFNLGQDGIYSDKNLYITVPNNPGVGSYDLASGQVLARYDILESPDATFYATGPDNCILLDNYTELCSTGSIQITERDDITGRLKGSFQFEFVNTSYNDPLSVTLDGSFDLLFDPPSSCE